ncbi:hypothetical protein QG37_05085 [Candidozyma auris]|nr:hypothetical protein QG37_05085 [[Candida] auris]
MNVLEIRKSNALDFFFFLFFMMMRQSWWTQQWGSETNVKLFSARSKDSIIKKLSFLALSLVQNLGESDLVSGCDFATIQHTHALPMIQLQSY